MKNFYSADSVDNIDALIDKALDMKAKPFADQSQKGKTALLLFFNPSLRTRISTQKAAQNLGMHAITMNANQGWKWEMEDGAVMKFDTSEHIKDAARVISRYADVVGIRAFPGLEDRDKDYRDEVMNAFMQYAEVPLVNLESSILHPCQSLADLITIRETQTKKKNKVVLSWAPHPKALPQAVSNSFLDWIIHTDNEIVITHPKGYELNERFTKGCTIEYDQSEAFEGADYIYTKNWSSYEDYGKILSTDESWMISYNKMNLTNNGKFMHCLPVRRNVVVADEVIDSDNSLVFQQAENRVYAAQAAIHSLLS